MHARSPLAQHAAYGVTIVLVGALGAAFAIGFRLALHAGLAALFGRDDVLDAFAALPRPWRVVAPAAGGLAAGLLGLAAARGAGGHGVGAILEAVTLGRGRISLRTTLWKAAASYAAIVTGGSLGREGSLVQFGAGVGGALADRAGLDARRARALVAAGAAAGFAAAYNTPVAAVLFVVEVVAGLATLDVVLPVVVATAVATALTRAAVGGGPIYGARAFALASPAELGAYLALGVLAGAVGAGFMAALAAGARAFRATRLPAPVRPALGGALVGALACALPAVTGNGYEAIQRILDGRVPLALLAVLLAAKAAATVASVSSGSPGGVFTPALFLGAALGGLVGGAARALPGVFGPHVVAGGYALVGMAALTAATTHAPLMAAVLVFELSGDYAIVLPLLLATAVATVVARRLRPDSVYTEELRRRGVAWEGSLAERLARAVRARDIMDLDPPVVAADAPLADALARLATGPGRRVYVTSDGPVRAIDLHAAREAWARGAAPEVTAGEAARPVPTATPDDTLLDLNEKLWEVDWGELPVVDPATGRLDGVVTRRALLGALDRELLGRGALLTRVVWSDGDGGSAEYLELPRGHRVEVVAPPAWAVGGALSPHAVRRDHGVAVLAVRRSERDAVTWLDADAAGAVRAGDRLVVVGAPAQVAAFRASAAAQSAG